MLVREWLGPFTIPAASQALRAAVDRIQPDLVHAMRIPYEGMTAAAADLKVPLLISVWGNDFSLHARSSPWMALWTRRALIKTDALQADCRRDVRLAGEWGFQPGKPNLVIPGNGGIRTEIFHRPAEPIQQPVVINPRGFRGYVRNDSFFKSIPLVLKQIPEARFICSAMAGEPQAETWIEKLGIRQVVQLLPQQPHARMGDIFRKANVLVSASTHDGTPNSVLEGMACGCFPVAGRLESLEEWITHGRNGLLVDPADPGDLAQAVLTSLTDPELRQKAAEENASLLASRAEYSNCMQQAGDLYREMISKGN